MSKSNCSLCKFWHSSIGKKIIVAVTGAFLVVFLLGHLSGNLLMYVGAEAFNDYAKFLHNMLHGAGVWLARIVLLTCIVLHVAATISLVRANKIAKGQNYEKQETNVASSSSRIMIWSGLTILAFVIFHILHYTTRSTSDRLKELGDSGNAYQMVIEGFKSIPVSLFYIIAITLLCSHLSHGVASIFQTLGLRTRGNAALIDTLAKGYTAVIWVGFVSIPVAALTGLIK
jgi:succinate dehydrogenase / fumarate reductase, cytochrome b subunit